MHATHWIIGCALCFAFVGAAAAASLDSQSVDNGNCTATTPSAHDGDDSIAGDVLGTNRGNSSPGTSSATSGTARSGNDRSGAASSAPAPAPRPHLGWQSLLPGSIQ